MTHISILTRPCFFLSCLFLSCSSLATTTFECPTSDQVVKGGKWAVPLGSGWEGLYELGSPGTKPSFHRAFIQKSLSRVSCFYWKPTNSINNQLVIKKEFNEINEISSLGKWHPYSHRKRTEVCNAKKSCICDYNDPSGCQWTGS